MSAFATLLARDWREQRFSILAVLALGAVVATIGVLVADPWVADSQMFAGIVAYSFGSLVALAVGCDLMARDRAEGSMAWVLRMPLLGCSVAMSKMAFLVAVTTAGTAVGVLVAWSLSQVLGTGSIEFGTWLQIAKGLVFVTSLALWTAAASSFLPRGFFAAPGGLVLVTACSAPFWVPLAHYGIRPSLTHQWTWGLGCLVGGAIALRVGATAGHRQGGRLLRRAGLVTAAGAMAFAPSAAQTAAIVHDIHTFDLQAPGNQLGWIYLSGNGRYLVGSAGETTRNGWKGGDWHALAYDIELGQWTSIGLPRRFVAPARGDDLLDGRVDRFAVSPKNARRWSPEDSVSMVLDGNLERTEYPPAGEPTVSHPLADDREWKLAGRAGFGWRYEPVEQEPRRVLWTDATGTERLERGDAESWDTTEVGAGHVARVWRVADCWLGAIYPKQRKPDDPLVLAEYDPQRGGWTRPEWSEGLTVTTVLATGEVLGMRGAAGAGEIVLVDPTSGRTRPTELQLDGLRQLDARFARGPEPWTPILATTDAGAGLLIVEDVGLGEPELTWTGVGSARFDRIAARLDDGSWVVSGPTETWQLRPDGSPERRLWPITAEGRN